MSCNPNLTGLFAVMMFTISAANTAIYEDIYNDNYLDDSYGYDDDKEELSQLISKIHTTTSTISTVEHLYDIPRIRYKCPYSCYCSTDFKVVDCSNRKLTKIPANIPCTAMRINLSSNFIVEMNDEDFEQCSNAQEIVLHTNKLQRINKKVFANLRELQSLDLAKNSLTHIPPDMFLWAQNLRSINFSQNNITFSKGSFLNFPNLEKLQLQGCNLQRLEDNIFQNLSGLLSLDLNENEFQAFNVKAFKPLVALQELKLPTISKYSVQELCNLMGSVDSISFGKQSISCFVLVSGTSFEQSIIQENQNGKAKKTTVISTLGTTQIYTASNVTEQATTSKGYSVVTTREESKDDSANKPLESISASAINKILIGIIIFAVIGLAIGIIRRKDICGLKTKLCRTRRPASLDTIQVAEAAPLNKI